VRSRHLQQRHRNDLAWYVAGFVLVQIGLGVGVERFWPAVRDPEFAELEWIVKQRQAEAPDRPLVLFLGSSRTRSGLRAELLNRPADPRAPLVMNSAVNGSGPMLQSLVLRRMLRAGLRPTVVFVETIPMMVSIRDGTPSEENLPASRLTATEAARLRPYLERPVRLYARWLRSRASPIDRNGAELRDALALDVPTAGPRAFGSGSDRYGWGGSPGSLAPHEVARLTAQIIDSYGPALRQPAVAPGALQAYRDLVTFARSRDIEVVFVMPPECSALREASPGPTECHASALRGVAHEMTVPLVDARTWIDDDGFWDGSHVTQRGADQYTERFGREVLTPLLSSRPSPTAASSTGRNGF
jgi:hypothetical protein